MGSGESSRHPTSKIVYEIYQATRSGGEREGQNVCE